MFRYRVGLSIETAEPYWLAAILRIVRRAVEQRGFALHEIHVEEPEHVTHEEDPS